MCNVTVSSLGSINPSFIPSNHQSIIQAIKSKHPTISQSIIQSIQPSIKSIQLSLSFNPSNPCLQSIHPSDHQSIHHSSHQSIHQIKASNHQSIHPNIHQIHPLFNPSIHQYIIQSSNHPSILQSINLAIKWNHPTTNQSIYHSIHPTIKSNHPTIHPFFNPSNHPSIHPSIQVPFLVYFWVLTHSSALPVLKCRAPMPNVYRFARLFIQCRGNKTEY